ncbi:hypothetical protein [Streptomyces smyrnaeus]|uniref:hypothetical protein n=1 Tax=Streptomyces smyrnaeus TaxID=1387713 RepID=UPI00369D6335
MDSTPTRQLVAGALASGLICWVFVAMLWNNYLGEYWLWPYVAIMPDSTRGEMSWVVGSWIYAPGIVAAIIVFFFRLGRWPELLRRIWHRDDAASTAARGAAHSAAAANAPSRDGPCAVAAAARRGRREPAPG